MDFCSFNIKLYVVDVANTGSLVFSETLYSTSMFCEKMFEYINNKSNKNIYIIFFNFNYTCLLQAGIKLLI